MPLRRGLFVPVRGGCGVDIAAEAAEGDIAKIELGGRHPCRRREGQMSFRPLQIARANAPFEPERAQRRIRLPQPLAGRELQPPYRLRGVRLNLKPERKQCARVLFGPLGILLVRRRIPERYRSADAAVQQDQPQPILGLGVTAPRGFAEPGGRVRQIALDALALRVELRRSETRLRPNPSRAQRANAAEPRSSFASRSRPTPRRKQRVALARRTASRTARNGELTIGLMAHAWRRRRRKSGRREYTRRARAFRP